MREPNNFDDYCSLYNLLAREIIVQTVPFLTQINLTNVQKSLQ